MIRTKFMFSITEVDVICHKVGATSIHMTGDEVRVVVNVPPPTSKENLKSFCALLSFYGQFLEQPATVARELYRLLRKDTA